MQELIKVTTDNSGNNIVSAKDLYQYLQPQSEFSHWIKRMLEYGFEDGKDFASFLTESNGGRPSTDYALTLDCAKEISMIQRTEKGKQARQYFLECEKRAHNPVLSLSRLEVAKMLVAAEEEKEQLQQQIKLDAPKVLFANSVSGSNGSVLMAGLSKILSQNGIDMGQNKLFAWMRENGYLGTKGEYYNEPNQRYVEQGLFEVVVRASTDPKQTIPFRTTKVTGKGQIYFVNKFLQKQTA